MPSTCYRLSASLIGTSQDEHGFRVVEIPAGTVVRAVSTHAPNLVEVIWDGQSVQLWARELDEYGQRVLPPSN
jgi:hypothetical protein